MKQTLRTLINFLLLVTLLGGTKAFATDYIKDVLLIGHSNQTQFNALQNSLVAEGWIAINKDLNAGAGGDYIHLLYKKESSNDFNWGYVTDFRLSSYWTETINYQGRTYYPVPLQGSDDFLEDDGDLNNNAGGAVIFLYYTKDVFQDCRAVTGITFNDTQSGALGLNGGSTGYDLNANAGGDYIYMHFTTAIANPPLSGQGTAADPYIIDNNTAWSNFSTIIGNGWSSNKYYSLTNNISCTAMVGTSDHPFCGTFEGNGHTITVNINSSETGTAPFHYINGATIKNLTIQGTVMSSSAHASGLAGACGGTNTINSCVVLTNINAAGYCGGIVGHGGTSTLNLLNSYYAGTISGFNQYAGGLLGWCDGMTLHLTNCLFKGSFSPASGGLYHPIACKNGGSTVNTTVTGTYYLNSITPTATGNKVIPGAEGEAVSTTLIEDSWDLPVTAADGLTYYLYLSGLRPPYYYGFENNNLAGEGWTLQGNPYSKIQKASNNAHSGSRYMEMWGDNDYYHDLEDSYLISPEFDGRYGLVVSFYMRRSPQDRRSYAKLGYSTTTNDISSFTWGNTFTPTSVNYSLYEESLPKGTKYVAIKISPGYWGNMYVDDFSFEPCSEPAPVNLAVSNITDKTATLTWAAPESDATITGYAYQYKTTSDANWSAIETVGSNTTSVTFNDLTGFTGYQFRVKARYGSNESIYTNISFTTSMPLPYECGFENGINGWNQWNINWNYTGISDKFKHDGNYAYCIENFSSEGHGTQYLIAPQFPGDPISMSFYYYSDTRTGGSFFVGYSLGGGNPEQDFIWVSEIDIDDCYLTWKKYEHNFPTGTSYIAIKFDNYDQGYMRRTFFDDFIFSERSTYTKPYDLTVSSLTNHSATLTWASPNNTVTGYTYQYKKPNDANWSNETMTNSTSVTLNNLPINTTYDFRVKAQYGENIASNYVSIRFITEGDTESPPYYQGFEDGMGGWRVVDACYTTGLYSGTKIHSGDYGFEFVPGSNNQFLISPLLESNSAMRFSFYYRNLISGDGVAFYVGYSTTTKDPSAFTWGGVYQQDGEWKNYPFFIPADTKYVAIVWHGGDFLFIDDISIEPAVTQSVIGYGESTESDHWMFIASPVEESLDPENVGNIISGDENDYDLYRFNQSAAAEWENYKAHTEGFLIENGKGYLYAYKYNVTLFYVGVPNNNTSKTVDLVYTNNSPHADTRGWNLVGNPFPAPAYSNKSYYKMNAAGSDIEAVTNTSTQIGVCQGVLVRATGPNQTVTFTKAGSRSGDQPESKGSLELTLTKGGTRGEEFHDKAIVSFDEGTQLSKYIFNEEHAKLYIPQDGEDYAIAYSAPQGELPLNFKAKEDGEYTLTVTSTLTSQLSPLTYLHLIDNLTGTDVDMLTQPSYTFEGHVSDYASRFKLVFCAQSDDEGEDDHFAFVSNGEIIITEGDGTVQIIDMLGRQLYSHEIHSDFRLPTSGFLTPGIYVLRLINGEKIRTQKIVID